MIKETFKKQFIINKESYSKLGLVALINKIIKCGLRRAKFELIDEINLEGDNTKEFNKLWNLLTKEEKQNIKKYDSRNLGED